MPRPSSSPLDRRCADCGANLNYEGGTRAFGLLFCDEDCADAYEDDDANRDLEEATAYGEAPDWDHFG